MAVNCWVEPMIKFAGGFGVTAISESAGATLVVDVVVDVDEGVDEQATIANVKAITSARVRK